LKVQLNIKENKMKVFVIGAGNVGGGQVRSAVKAGHQVTVLANVSDQLAELVAETGATLATSIADGAKGADLVYLAIPSSAVAAVAAELKPVIGSAIVVDGTNPLNATFSDLEYKGESGAADLQALLPGVAVVKAFNTVFASRYSAPSQNGNALQVFIAGNDEAANGKVSEYAKSLGFDPVVLGGLRFAKSMEEMAFLNIALNASKGLTWQSAWSLTGPDGLK
jgi:predicted dinucleotide-binding enzyme